MTTIHVDIFYTASGLYDANRPPPSNTSSIRDFPKARAPSTPDLSQPSRVPVPPIVIPAPPVGLPNEDIRLCTIYRADPADTFGIELNFHRREQFHSLSIVPGRENAASSKNSLIMITISQKLEMDYFKSFLKDYR